MTRNHHFEIRSLFAVLLLGTLTNVSACKNPISKDKIESAIVESPEAPLQNPNRSTYLYTTSGFPTSAASNIIAKWTLDGDLIQKIYDYGTSTSLSPMDLVLKVLDGRQKLLSLTINGSVAQVNSMELNGGDSQIFIFNPAALTTGTRRLALSEDGGYLVVRTAGVEKFNSSGVRLGTAPRYAAGGTCVATALFDVTEAKPNATTTIVLAANAAASPNNKINLYQVTSGACIAGVIPTGPATSLVPVGMSYDTDSNQLYVLYYPFTGATTNAQIWRFDVGATTLTNGTLIFNDVGGDIAVANAAPSSLGSAIRFSRNPVDGTAIYVGTSYNSVVKLVESSGTWTKWKNQPLIFDDIFVRGISSLTIVTEE